MADQNTHQSRRPHFHRGRRGPDRRGPERRSIQHAPEQGGRDHVDVEQIMRDIRSRISQRHGIELSNQQIQELAARRLEAVLEPRNVKPGLLDQLRKNAGEAVEVPAASLSTAYTFEDTTLYDTHRGLLRFIRRLLNPILKLFFNPTPLIHALNTQARMNAEAAAREAERERRQVEWNALQYELVQRMVTEVSRVSLEMQALSMRIESLAAKVDFNERRVRGIESAMHQGRPPHRPAPSLEVAAVAAAARPGDTVSAEAPAAEGGETPRRRRRRRRGRRGGAGVADAQAGPDAPALGAEAEADEGDLADAGEAGDDEPIDPVTTEGESVVELE